MPVIKRKIQRDRAIRDAPKRTQWWLQTAKLNNMPKNNMAPCTPPEAFMPPPTELSPFHEWLEVASDRLKERIANGEVFVAGVFNSIWVGFDIHGKPTDIWA